MMHNNIQSLLHNNKNCKQSIALPIVIAYSTLLILILITQVHSFSFTLNEDGTLKGEGYDFDTHYKYINISENLVLLGKLDLAKSNSGTVIDLKTGIKESVTFQTPSGRTLLNFNTKESDTGIEIDYGMAVKRDISTGTVMEVESKDDIDSDIFVVRKSSDVGTLFKITKDGIVEISSKGYRKNFMMFN